MQHSYIVLFHGLDRFLDEIFGLLVKLCWLTAVLSTILLMKQAWRSAGSITKKITMSFVILSSLVLVTLICILLLPHSLITTTTALDLKALLGLGSIAVWLVIVLDIQAILKARRSQEGISIANIILVLFVPIIGAGYYLVSKRTREGKA